MAVSREMMGNPMFNMNTIIEQLTNRLAQDIVSAGRVELIRMTNDMSGLTEFSLKLELPETLNAQ
jgi:hypothetical protein